MQQIDLKKIWKPFFHAGSDPVFVEIPEINFLMIDGKGNPNNSPGYTAAIEALYSVAYTLKFSLKKGQAIDYPVMPLEGLWWADDMNSFQTGDKDKWWWTMMISSPDFITDEMLATTISEVSKKKSLTALPGLRLERFAEGVSAQLLHIGRYQDEADNIKRLHDFIHAHNYSFDGKVQKHHEIYLSDPRRTAPERLKTIIRQSVKR